jgi:hypothetical protein
MDCSDLFSTLHILASLPENQLAPKGAQTCFPAGAPLRWQGARKDWNSRPWAEIPGKEAYLF